MAKGKKKDYSFYNEIPTDFWTEKQLKEFIHTVGKRAQSRIKTLEKAYKPGGSLDGRQSYILDKYGDFTTKTKGLSDKALRLKVEQINRIMSARSSTVKGVKEIDSERLNAFKQRHKNAKIEYTDKSGRTRKRALNREEWQRAMQIMGKIQAAEKGGKYDSNEQLFMAFKLATTPDDGTSIDESAETISAENFLNESGDMLIHSDDFFANSNLSETMDFFDIGIEE